jgi:predicted DNA-binding transcriptional regulator AlpA
MTKPTTGTPAFGMSRVQAAHHIGIGVALFNGLVAQGKVPLPRKIGTRLIWLRHEVEDAIESLPYAEDPAERRSNAPNLWEVGLARQGSAMNSVDAAIARSKARKQQASKTK